jgi:hypothetical protein
MRLAYLNWYLVLIHVLAVLFGYWLCRDLKLSRGASMLGGLTFGLAGWIGSTDWPQMLNGAVWTPVIVLFLLRVARDHEPLRSGALAGGALGAAFLSGHHQIPTFTALAAAGLWTYLIVRGRRAMAAPLLAFAVLAGLTGALQILPAQEYGKLAVRWIGAPEPVSWNQPVPYSIQSDFGLFPTSLAGIVVPTIFRNASPYIGLTVITLALIGAAARWRRRDVRILVVLGLGALIFSLSSFAVFHGVIYSLIPLVEKARNPSMAIHLFHFAAAVLAAHGLDSVLSREPAAGPWSRRASIGLAAFAALLLIVLLSLILAGNPKVMEHERVLLVPFLAIAAAALLYAIRRGNLTRRAALALTLLLALFEFGHGDSVYGWRHRDQPGSLLRTLARDGDIAAFLGRQPGLTRVEIDMEAVPYNFGDWYGIDAFDSYAASIAANVYGVQANYAARMLFGLNFFIGRKPSREGQIEIFTGQGGLKVYVNPEAAPRVWTAHAVEQVPSTEAPFRLLKPVAELRAKPFMTATPPQLASCDAGDRVRVVTREPNRIAIDTEMRCRGLVILGDAFFPGWHARIDGAPTAIHEVYGALRAVVVEAGRHRIEMVYRPRPVVLGAAGTALGLLATCLAAIGRRPRLIRARSRA